MPKHSPPLDPKLLGIASLAAIMHKTDTQMDTPKLSDGCKVRFAPGDPNAIHVYFQSGARDAIRVRIDTGDRNAIPVELCPGTRGAIPISLI